MVPEQLFVFPSLSRWNIKQAFEHRVWAIPPQSDLRFVKQIATKSDQMPPGSVGLIYCSQTKSLTMPFQVTSPVDRLRRISDVWIGDYILPFKINPLSKVLRNLSKDRLMHLPSLLYGRNGTWCNFFKCRPVQVFLPTKITERDWDFLSEALIC